MLFFLFHFLFHLIKEYSLFYRFSSNKMQTLLLSNLIPPSFKGTGTLFAGSALPVCLHLCLISDLLRLILKFDISPYCFNILSRFGNVILG